MQTLPTQANIIIGGGAIGTSIAYHPGKLGANFVRSRGLERFELSPAEIKQKFPLIETTGILSGFWTPTDGCANAVNAMMSMAAGARAITAEFLRGHRWEIDVHDRRIPATPSLTPFYDLKNERVRG